MEMVTKAKFEISQKINTDRRQIIVTLARPLAYREHGDSEFETMKCRAINAQTLQEPLPEELKPFAGWVIQDVIPA